VSAVVAVMSIFCKKKCKSWSANPKNEKHSCQKLESDDFLEENPRRLRNFSQKMREGWILKKIAPKPKKLELNSTNLMLKSKKTHLDCAKVPDPSNSYGLKVKNNKIGGLLNSGLCWDLLFMKKKVQQAHFHCKAGCPSVMGHFQLHIHHR
jgi:hypothetical protein